MNTNPKTKRILCYGDSNTWGWVPLKMGQERFPVNVRWTGILQNKLGADYEIIEDGIGGRNTITDDPRPDFEKRNGLETLPLALEGNLPLDWIVIMLGTTELKEMFNMSAQEIAEGLRKIVSAIKNYRVLVGTEPPKILIVIPAVIIETTESVSGLFKGGTKKSEELIKEYQKICKEEDVECLNSNEVIKVDMEEGIHIDKKAHKKLGEFIYEKIIK